MTRLEVNVMYDNNDEFEEISLKQEEYIVLQQISDGVDWELHRMQTILNKVFVVERESLHTFPIYRTN